MTLTEEQGGFDLERARGLRDFLQDDCAEVGDVWAEMIAEIERLQKFRDRIARILKQPFTDCDDLLILGLGALLCHLRRQAAEIESLKVEMDNYGDDFVCQMKSKDARIKELEDAHKRSGAKYAKIINELRSSVYANIPGLKKQWDEILNAPANGKIGPDARPRSWQITEERKDALRDAAETLADRSLGDWETIDVLNVMLTEADHDKP